MRVPSPVTFFEQPRTTYVYIDGYVALVRGTSTENSVSKCQSFGFFAFGEGIGMQGLFVKIWKELTVY